MAALPRLTELTVIYPDPDNNTLVARADVPLDTVEAARSATLELVDACKALPDFDTLQIVYRLCVLVGLSDGGDIPSSQLERVAMEHRNRVLRERVDTVKGWAIERLKRVKPGCQGGDGRKKTTLRIIELNPRRPLAGRDADPAKVEKVEEYEL